MTENYLQVFKKNLTIELESIADYIRHSSTTISEAQQQFEKKFETIEDGQIVIKDDAVSNDEYSKFHAVFPHFFRLSTFIGLFSYFENQLVKLCHRKSRYQLSAKQQLWLHAA